MEPKTITELIKENDVLKKDNRMLKDLIKHMEAKYKTLVKKIKTEKAES